MARVGLKEQTFLGGTEKKIDQVVKMRGFLLGFDRSSSCRECRVSRGPHRLAIIGACFRGISMVFPWRHRTLR